MPNDSPCPCDSCDKRKECGEHKLACESFYLWTMEKSIKEALREPAPEWFQALERDR